jgi:hypothetical protein
MKIVGICGAPATGKTTLVHAIIDHYGIDTKCISDFQSLKYLYSKRHKIIILGIYDKTTAFGGTDKLSMSVINDAEEFIRAGLDYSDFEKATIIYEGDRLWCARWIEFIINLDIEYLFLYLKLNHDEFAHRHILRMHDKVGQEIQFINSRITKYANLMNTFPVFQVADNSTLVNQKGILQTIYNFIEKKD